jgi:succinate-semialdehyde dehydrogenase/glutarate-semialdehyde dehydrogenase
VLPNAWNTAWSDNAGAISTELAPFGGVKESGNSREGSHHGID